MLPLIDIAEIAGDNDVANVASRVLLSGRWESTMDMEPKSTRSSLLIGKCQVCALGDYQDSDLLLPFQGN